MQIEIAGTLNCENGNCRCVYLRKLKLQVCVTMKMETAICLAMKTEGASMLNCKNRKCKYA